MQVSVATILAGCVDLAGDPLVLTANTNSANGGSVAVTESWVTYTPPAGITNADSFGYTVTDPYGGAGSGTISVAIASAAQQTQNLSISGPVSGWCQIFGNGLPSYTYHLQSTGSLNPPNWQNVDTVTADQTGQLQYNLQSSNSAGYYRFVYP